jgi:hypothetical protein
MNPKLFLIVALLGISLGAHAQFDGVRQVGTMRHFAITESSGLSASRAYPGILWTHNDGGFQFLFAVTETGNMIGAFQVPGNLIDWEDIAIDSSGNLYLADIGTNGMVRTHVAVHRVKEPNPYKRYGNAKVNQTWLLRFPGGAPQDCESFFVRGGFGYLITKRPVRGTVSMFRFALADRRSSILLQHVARIPVDSSITAADLSVDGQRLALTSSDGVYLFFLTGPPASASSARRLFFDFENDFMEGGTFYRKGFLASSETRQLWLFSHPSFRCQQPPRLLTQLTDQTVTPGTTVRFEIIRDGCPFPRITWRFNGSVIPGATNAILELANVSAAQSGVYEVVAANRFGTVTDNAVLTIRTKPDVRVTEVMPFPAPGAPVRTADWFEITNFEPIPMDLSGWRFNDSVGGLSDAFAIPPGLVLQPGESVIFAEELSSEEFRVWWGANNVPSSTPVITYSGSGLSFRVTGDALFLWDNTSTDPADFVHRAEFGAADPGVSFIYDPSTDAFGTKSRLGAYGAVRAARSSDIGSPSRLTGF